MNQLKLFEVPEQKPPKPKHRCRDCKHMYVHEYNKNMAYCSLYSGRNTAYGDRKVKKLQAACHSFEKK